ncbi:hypothetical protein Tco_1518911, partial [Tanacetum coccineum]
NQSALPTDPQTTPNNFQNTPQQQKTQTYRRRTRKDSKIPQFSVPTSPHVADEAAFTSMDDRHGGAATTGTSLDAGQGSGNIHKTPSISYDSLTRGNTLGSDEDRLKLQELMETCTDLQQRVLGLENNMKKIKTAHALKIASLNKKIKRLERHNMSRIHKLKRLYKVGLTSRIESSGSDDDNLEEDASIQGRKSDSNMFDNYLNADEEINEDNENVDNVADDVVMKAQEVQDVVEEVVDVINTAKVLVDTSKVSIVKVRVSTAREEVSTAREEVSTISEKVSTTR